MKNFPKTQKILITIIILNIVAFFSYFLLFSSIKEKNQQTSLSLNNTELELKKNDRYESVRDILSETESERKIIDSYFVNKEKIVDFIESIEGLGKQSGVAVHINSVGEDEGALNTLTLPLLHLSIEAEGDFRSVFTFLSLLENLPFKTVLPRVALERQNPEQTISGISSSKKKVPVWKGSFELSVAKNI